MAILRALVQSVKNFHHKNQMTSNTLMTIGLLGAGDLITQYIEIKVVNSPGKFEFPSSEELWKVAQKFELPKSEDLYKITFDTFDIAAISNMFTDSSKKLKAKKKVNEIDKEEDKADKDNFLAKIDWKRAGTLN